MVAAQRDRCHSPTATLQKATLLTNSPREPFFSAPPPPMINVTSTRSLALPPQTANSRRRVFHFSHRRVRRQLVETIVFTIACRRRATFLPPRNHKAAAQETTKQQPKQPKQQPKQQPTLPKQQSSQQLTNKPRGPNFPLPTTTTTDYFFLPPISTISALPSPTLATQIYNYRCLYWRPSDHNRQSYE